MKLQPARISIRSLLLATLALALLTSCGLIPTPGQLRTRAAYARFTELCKNVAGVKIYRSVDDVEGIVLLKVRPERDDLELADLTWPGAAFARERSENEYISSFLEYEHSSSPTGEAVNPPFRRGYVNSTYIPDNPSNLRGYRYVDVLEAGTGMRWRYTLAQRPRPTSKIGTIDIYLDRRPAPAERPRYGVTFEDHVIPEDRAQGIASSTVKVVDLHSGEVLAEMLRYAWGSTHLTYTNSWLSADVCPGSPVGVSTGTRHFVDQVLKPIKE